MKPAKPVSETPAIDLFSFRWVRAADGYELRNPETAASATTSALLADMGPLIYSKGGALVDYAPRAIPDLHRRFAAMGDSPEDVLAFVQEYGFTALDLRDLRGFDPFQTVGEILQARDHLRGALDAFQGLEQLRSRAMREIRELREAGVTPANESAPGDFRNTAAGFFNQWATPKLKVQLVPSSGGTGLVLALQPTSLLASMWLQVAEELSGGARFSSCQWCRAPMTGRVGRLTCSDACRQAKSLHNRQQKAATAATKATK